ncbi:MAG TPA: hypothetical protein VJ694_02755 [Patescibacteria group bacterium]|nr:hypothetical protein [Patescibacteria group bacterium]
MSKPFPDFSLPEFRHVGARGRMELLREYVLTRDAPVPPDEVRRLFAELCELSVEMLRDTKIVSRHAMDADDSMRLLNVQIALVQPAESA